MDQTTQNPKPEAALPANHCIVHKFSTATIKGPDGKQEEFVTIAVTGTERPGELLPDIPIPDEKGNIIAYVRNPLNQGRNANVKYGSFIPQVNGKAIAPNSVEYHKLRKMWPVGKPLAITRNGQQTALYLMSDRPVIAKKDNPDKGHTKGKPIGGLYELDLNPEML